MKKRSSGQQYLTHLEIENAMMSFFNGGGKIKVLPQQKMTTLDVIGSPKWDAYENIQDLYF
ncbi:hypothetical protein WDW89_10445 [Deltaproteobacteria bacterium TL4]